MSSELLFALMTVIMVTSYNFDFVYRVFDYCCVIMGTKVKQFLMFLAELPYNQKQ